MMQGIGKEMNERTGALSNFGPRSGPPKFLDLCMAPGGFSQFLLKLNPTAHICGISLPVSKGGHKLFLDIEDSRVTVNFMDITFLCAEMQDSANAAIPSDHPDASNFIETRPYLSEVFDLVICDGQVLRTHKRAEYREPVEATRLLVSQLVLGLQRIRAGGTMVVLLHKLEMWSNLQLLYMFSKFSEVQLFKPAKSHAIRSSFYLIAKGVQPHNPHAVKAISTWKRAWLATTFRSRPEDTTTEKEVQVALSQFGEHYVRLGIPIWSIQKAALERSSFC
jgi:23S rRNA U2552 (ribose-2'-O)-methylase RlmE/FtsJ